MNLKTSKNDMDKFYRTKKGEQELEEINRTISSTHESLKAENERLKKRVEELEAMQKLTERKTKFRVIY